MTNKLLENAPKGRTKVTVQDLEKLAVDLNREYWVSRLGRHYFVQREKNPKFRPGSDDPKEREFIYELAWNG